MFGITSALRRIKNGVFAVFAAAAFALAVLAVQAVVLTQTAAAQSNAAANMTLLAEIGKPSPSLVTVVQALDANADPDVVDANGVPALIVAATLGHARIVAALVTAGANVGATDPNFHNADVVQHMAAPLTSPAVKDRAARATVLYHFGDALHARNGAAGVATFNWNRPDARGNRALDLLVMAEDADLSAMPALQAKESVSVIYQMSDYMLARDAACGDATTDKTRRVCAGLACAAGETTHDGACVELDAALIAEVKKSPPDLFVVGALLDDGANATLTLAGGVPLVITAQALKNLKAMSVLITGGRTRMPPIQPERGVPPSAFLFVFTMPTCLPTCWTASGIGAAPRPSGREARRWTGQARR